MHGRSGYHPHTAGRNMTVALRLDQRPRVRDAATSTSAGVFANSDSQQWPHRSAQLFNPLSGKRQHKREITAVWPVGPARRTTRQRFSLSVTLLARQERTQLSPVELAGLRGPKHDARTVRRLETSHRRSTPHAANTHAEAAALPRQAGRSPCDSSGRRRTDDRSSRDLGLSRGETVATRRRIDEQLGGSR